MYYRIVVEEVLSRVITVEAKTSEEAFHLVKKQYQNEEILLDASDFVQVEFYEIK